MAQIMAPVRYQTYSGRWTNWHRVPRVSRFFGFQGQATDIEIHAREILKMKDTLNQIISKHTGQPFEKVRTDTDRDFFMSAHEANEYGIVDEVIESIKK